MLCNLSFATNIVKRRVDIRLGMARVYHFPYARHLGCIYDVLRVLNALFSRHSSIIIESNPVGVKHDLTAFKITRKLIFVVISERHWLDSIPEIMLSIWAICEISDSDIFVEQKVRDIPSCV